MTKKVAGFIIVLSSVLAPATAWADHGGGYYDRDNRECRGGGCDNEREENYDQTGCKYFCPAFDDSPVQDSFNVCLPGATCHWHGREEGSQGGGSSGNPQ